MAIMPAHVAMVIGAEHDDDPVEPALTLVQVVREVTGDVRRLSVALDDDPVFVVPERRWCAATPLRPSRRCDPSSRNRSIGMLDCADSCSEFSWK